MCTLRFAPCGAGRFRAQPAHQRRHDQQVDVVDDDHPKGVRGSRGVERRGGLEHALHGGQRLLHARQQGHRAFGRHKASAGAHQQLVVKQITQLGERRAHRGLPDLQPLGGAGDVTLAQQGVEGEEHVQV